MPRSDLLALSIDDLAVLSNRGIVKRSQQELLAGDLAHEVREDSEGNVTVTWSDGLECLLPANVTAGNGRCSCPATSICRHLIRSILVYQDAHSSHVQMHEPQMHEPETPENLLEKSTSKDWNPGDISDTAIASLFSKNTIAKLQKQFAAGLVLYLTCGRKPTAHIHTLSLNLRFLVPGDARYTHCDCAEASPCSHVPLAIWAFRLLPVGESHGIVSTSQESPTIPIQLLDDADRLLLDLARSGIAGASAAFMEMFRQLEHRYRRENAVWPAEIVSELLQEYESYARRDARFSGDRTLALIGELGIRNAAMRRPAAAVPQIFVRGTSGDRAIELGAARLLGLGCGVTLRRSGVELSAYLQDTNSGTVMAICKHFPDPIDEPYPFPKDFHQLAQSSALRGTSFAAIATGQLTVKGGKRSPGYQFIPGRAQMSFTPQGYQWENLRPPILVTEFAELSDRLGDLLPASLRPRRVTENFHVCRIGSIESVHFSAATQSVRALLRDREGQVMTLIHPYMTRGREGVESLLSALGDRALQLRFVAGPVRLDGRGLTIHPVALIFEGSQGRSMLQPWIERDRGNTTDSAELPSGLAIAQSPYLRFLAALAAALGDLWLVGLPRSDASVLARWRSLLERGKSLGLGRFLVPVEQLILGFTENISGNSAANGGAKALLSLSILVKLAQEES